MSIDLKKGGIKMKKKKEIKKAVKQTIKVKTNIKAGTMMDDLIESA
jgi:hypothetical protein